MMNDIRLYYIKHRGKDDLAQIDHTIVDRWLAALSEQKKAVIQRLLRYEDRLTSLVGSRLLSMCARDEGVSNFRLSEIQYPEAGKPFWKEKDCFYDFNISHSGSFIVVVTSTTSRVGIDIEQIRALKRLSFKRVMSVGELEKIQQTPALFFDLWSKKEAVVKAADTVGIARMRDVKLGRDTATLDDECWYLKSIGLDSDYAVSLASSEPIGSLIVKQIALADLGHL
ncbi:MAG TPA: 4'-phosphopantetheinyl transferase superfamily protein [Gammaproteobacteria bacterium]|nr:4'-phosphopantetheinyl transferase superfamily protein [Gammaproteobacteria bacterium]